MAMFLDSLLQQKEAIMKKWHLKVLEARGTWHEDAKANSWAVTPSELQVQPY